MVVIRLLRGGAKKRPFYTIIAVDSRKRRDSGRCLERIGYFNPVARGQEVRLFIDTEKMKYWQGVGAQCSDRVAQLNKEYSKTVLKAVASTDSAAS